MKIILETTVRLQRSNMRGRNCCRRQSKRRQCSDQNLSSGDRAKRIQPRAILEVEAKELGEQLEAYCENNSVTS